MWILSQKNTSINFVYRCLHLWDSTSQFAWQPGCLSVTLHFPWNVDCLWSWILCRLENPCLAMWDTWVLVFCFNDLSSRNTLLVGGKSTQFSSFVSTIRYIFEVEKFLMVQTILESLTFTNSHKSVMGIINWYLRVRFSKSRNPNKISSLA